MNPLYKLVAAFGLLTGCLFFQSAQANNPTYEARRTAFISDALANFGPDAITLQAYQGVPLDTAALNSMLRGISANVTADFAIVKLIRILYFTNGAYDTLILPVLNNVPFWINKGDLTRNYWSENHMCMWTSSDWLLHERYGKTVDSTLDKRLRHYLKLKVQYGFYEFFSSVYAPYCLSGLLNLADFAQDAEIKNLATLAAQRLMGDMLMLTNDKGTFFPTAGRNYYGKYETPYGQNHNNLIYLLTGLGPAPGYGSHAGSFLASSTIPVDSVSASWTPYLDTIYRRGHTIDTGLILNADQYFVDRVVFQWTAGEYFHPLVAADSYTLLTDSNLWHQTDFSTFSFLSTVAPSTVPALATSLSCASESGTLCGGDIDIYKHNSITLSSVPDFWKGKLGYQEFPCVANVGTTAVFTASGAVLPWDNRSANNANADLPYVQQKKNIALIMYRPEVKLATLGFNHHEVSLFWTEADFDEIVNDSMWLLGRQGNSYVAVRRSCDGYIDSMRACSIPNGQAWAIMVGDSALYGSFSNFQSLIHQSQFSESWYYDSINMQSVFYAKVIVDTTTIEYAWGVDSVTTGINALKGDEIGLNIFPNPANDVVHVEVANVPAGARMDIYNTFGQSVCQTAISASNFSIPVSGWSAGVYVLKLTGPDSKKSVGRFVISH